MREVIRGLDIDHGVAPVAHTRGGSDAGYRRWDRWVALERGGGLKEYARRRNNALQTEVGARRSRRDDEPVSSARFQIGSRRRRSCSDRERATDASRLYSSGVSRMSAYLNLGMVSPLRMTRDVLARGAGSCQKFLDEFHTWREISYAHCFHHPDTHRTVEGLPQWAQATLNAHAGDARGPIIPMERLAAAKTGHDLWVRRTADGSHS